MPARRWSPPPIDIRVSKRITSALSTSLIGIRYLTEKELGGRRGEGTDGERLRSGGGTCATEILTLWTKSNWRNYHFTHVFCESVGAIAPVEPAHLPRGNNRAKRRGGDVEAIRGTLYGRTAGRRTLRRLSRLNARRVTISAGVDCVCPPSPGRRRRPIKFTSRSPESRAVNCAGINTRTDLISNCTARIRARDRRSRRCRSPAIDSMNSSRSARPLARRNNFACAALRHRGGCRPRPERRRSPRGGAPVYYNAIEEQLTDGPLSAIAPTDAATRVPNESTPFSMNIRFNPLE
ncbi:hypothetical protein EVAR_46301_1 [Eumeta japonica]|uniref:Uncharacterized protein n=1 Tax=Eumeta variegata TaxID=151549 RepID=A0A4C1XX37_EUMVA|nr:hypothetical protein EVAR_46301_1 [Eumeta japonica]